MSLVSTSQGGGDRDGSPSGELAAGVHLGHGLLDDRVREEVRAARVRVPQQDELPARRGRRPGRTGLGEVERLAAVVVHLAVQKGVFRCEAVGLLALQQAEGAVHDVAHVRRRLRLPRLPSIILLTIPGILFKLLEYDIYGNIPVP